jgi:hypothetical protein
VGRTATGKAMCAILVEGPGNSSDSNYYPASALQNSYQAFEGARAFLDHSTESQALDRPEGSLRDLAGWWSSVHLGHVGGALAIVGTLNFSSSNTGEVARRLVSDAIQYQEQQPGGLLLGVSINASGPSHTDEIEGRLYNVVDAITNVSSADLVTRPGARGQVLQMLEAARGRYDAQTGRERAVYRRETVEGGHNLETSPPGWEDTVKAMKDHPGIDNPYALAWSMKDRGYTPRDPKGRARSVEALLRRHEYDLQREANSASALGQLDRQGVRPVACSTCGDDCSCVECEECNAKREAAACSEDCACSGMEEVMADNVADANRQLMADGKIAQLRDLQRLAAAARDSADPKTLAALTDSLQAYLAEQLDLAHGGADQGVDEESYGDPAFSNTEGDDPQAQWLRKNLAPPRPSLPSLPSLANTARPVACRACGHVQEAERGGTDAVSYFRERLGLPLPATARSAPISAEARYFVEALQRSPAAMRADELVAQGVHDPRQIFLQLNAGR